MTVLEATIARARARFCPPPRLPLSLWMETHMRLPEGLAAKSGPVRLWPFQRGIADAISDPDIERVTVLKCVRVGYSTLLVGAIGSFVANEPAPIMLLLPTDDDCRDFIVSDMEPIFDATPAIAGLISAEADESGRNTMKHRRFPGGSLKIVPGRSPRNLRKHTVRILLIDEEDGIEVTGEGDAIDLAIKRTLSFVNRKIVRGSTPVDLETSTICREYEASDQRVFEIKCVECGDRSEPKWSHIHWDKEKDAQGRTVRHVSETAKWACPKCGTLIAERYKAEMVENGEWRATRPDVKGHAGFRLNALISPHVNAGWSKLVAEFVEVHDDAERLRTFKNTLLGEGWAEAVNTADPAELATRVEDFGLNTPSESGAVLQFPAEVLVVTAGVDVQDDRLEVVIVGWNRESAAYILGHFIVYGTPGDDTTWRELDETLLTQWEHPLGARIGIDAVVVDAGDGGWVDQVYAYCWSRGHRHVMAGKGRFGNRPAIEMSKGKVARGKLAGKDRLWIIGVDTIKAAIYQRLSHYKDTIRFSKVLPLIWFEQLAAEHRVIRKVGGRPVARFERIGAREAEALDCTVYAFAARQAVSGLNFDVREAALSRAQAPAPKKKSISDYAKRLNG
ncbi:phage terminase large subunit family protein [Lichenihabitans sp. PAMC28606]|uniref:phage terminase large subunit family protein n=1 Tax=Lichenihabitans sp. PAMC28606 TaxID=2880932 RepID=UPI001D0B248C|nr:terminase gpA endonuclease subunit [Lichenihabitans sp. PAMC28606]UDL95496.1 phage terminase large subunit family protein [Lichenihabitans sp. PAMC28606]